MSSHSDDQSGDALVERGLVRLAGGLLVLGLLVYVLSTLMHPSGHEDVHATVFTSYADSDAWVAVHLGQFIGVLLALAALLAVYPAMKGTPRLSTAARFLAGSTVVTAAVWAVLQGLDGVALKQAVDSWANASGAERQISFASAESIRWLEWGFQSYFRLMLGLSFALFGAILLAGRLVARWIGVLAVLAGAISVVIGVDIGYSGLASQLQDLLGMPFLLTSIAVGIGLATTGTLDRRHHARVVAPAGH